MKERDEKGRAIWQCKEPGKGLIFSAIIFLHNLCGWPLQLSGTFWRVLHRLYEQQKTAPEGAVNLGEYVTRWRRWTLAGLGKKCVNHA